MGWGDSVCLFFFPPLILSMKVGSDLKCENGELVLGFMFHTYSAFTTKAAIKIYVEEYLIFNKECAYALFYVQTL